MTDIYCIALLSLTRSSYLNFDYLRSSGKDAFMVTTSANNWGRVQVAASGDSSPDPNWLARVSTRTVRARPHQTRLAGHCVWRANRRLAWRVVV